MIAGPLPIVGGSGSPCRVLALVEVLMLVAEAVADALAGLGADTVFGVVGSGNFHVTNGADRARRPVRRRPARVRRGQHGRRLGPAGRASRACCRCTRDPG